MVLYKLHEFDSNYRDAFNGDDIKGLDVYTEASQEKIGSVHDALVDEDGRFRYLIVDTGFWIFGKKVLLPIGSARIDYNSNRAYARISKDQVETLPNFNDLDKVDYDHEEQVRGVYRPMAATSGSTLTNDAGSYAANDAITGSAAVGATRYDRDSYSYDRDPSLYNLNDQDHQTLKLYEERLIANKRRAKTGEVAVGKHVETQHAQVSVPVDKERVVVERVAATDTRPATGIDNAFHEGEVARIEVYEETPDIRKEAFVREEVRVKKVVEQEMVNAEDEIRRESLDIDKDGNPIISENR